MNHHEITPGTATSARNELGLSQAMVAREIGLNRAHLSEFERGKRILEDRWLDALLEFFIGEGWQPSARSDKEVSQQPNAEPAPFTVADGFVLAKPEIDSATEALLDEYYENTLAIEQEWSKELPRGIFGGLDSRAVQMASFRALILSARQCQIVQELRGQTYRRNPDADLADDSTIRTVGDFILAVLDDLQESELPVFEEA